MAPVYPQRRVVEATDVVDMADWWQAAAQADEQFFMGIACNDQGIGLANREQGWHIPTDSMDVLTNQSLGRLIKTTLSKMLSGRECPPLIAQHILTTTGRLASICGWGIAEVDEFVSHFRHEVRALSWASGIQGARNFPSPVMEALDACTVGPQMAIDLGNYYKAVGLPHAKFVTTSQHERLNEGYSPPRQSLWTVTYPNLLLRVLAHYTREPFLYRLFDEHPDEEPVGAIAKHLEIGDKQEALSLILWLAWGEDVELFTTYWRDRIIPEHAALWRSSKIDKKLPVLRLWLAEEKEKLGRERASQTLYGRPLHDRRASRLLAHELLGSVHDIMEVAVVSLANNDSTNHRVQDTARTWERGVIVGHTNHDPAEWESEVAFIAKLGNPLVLPLGAKVHVE